MKPSSSFLRRLSQLLGYVVYWLKRFLKKIVAMNRYDQIIAVGVLAVIVLLVFSPLVIISPNSATITTSFGFLLSFSFIKSFIIIVGALVINLLFLFNKKVKLFFIEKLGFQGNMNIISAFFLAIALSSFLSLGEMINLVSNYTTVVKLTGVFYIIQILLIVLLAFCIVLIFSSQKSHYRGHVVGFSRRQSGEQATSGKGLFDEMQDNQE